MKLSKGDLENIIKWFSFKDHEGLINDEDIDLINRIEKELELDREPVFPNDSYSFEVFAIKDSPTGKQAFVGYKLSNDNFEYIQIPYTGQ